MQFALVYTNIDAHSSQFPNGIDDISESHIQMEAMKMNHKYIKLEKTNTNHQHHVIISIKQKNIDFIKQYVTEQANVARNTSFQWYSYEDIQELTSNQDGSIAVVNWLESNGVNVTYVTKGCHYIKATASISIWQQLLRTDFHMYQLSPHYQSKYKKAHSGYVSIGDRVIPRASTYHIPISMGEHIECIYRVSHLPVTVYNHKHIHPNADNVPNVDTNINKLHSNPHSDPQSDPIPHPNSITPSNVAFINNLYGVPPGLTGNAYTSQSVFETAEQGYSPSDLTLFQTNNHVHQQTANDIGGYSDLICNVDDGNCDEGNLDIQFIMGLSQYTTSYYWYVTENSNEDPFVAYCIELSEATNPPLSNSISWGTIEQDNYPSTMNAFDTELIKLAAMGVTVMVSSGDDGVSGDECGCDNDSGSAASSWSGTNSWSGTGYFPSFPASSPYVVAVGGTMGPNEGSPESVCSSRDGGVITSGGGFSTYYPRPTYQDTVIPDYLSLVSGSTTDPTSGYNPSGRGYPDISMLATYYPVVIAGRTLTLFGTSASSPVFAAMISLINAER